MLSCTLLVSGQQSDEQRCSSFLQLMTEVPAGREQKKTKQKNQDYFTRHQMNAKIACHRTKRGRLTAINIITDYESIVADKKF